METLMTGSPVRLTVTELVDWQDCPLIWLYHDKMGLRPKSRPIQLSSGTAVHKLIEQMTKGQPWVDGVEQAAADALREQGLDDDEVRRYTAGVVRAVRRAPTWLNAEGGWSSEVRVAHTWPSRDVEVRGHPDLFRVADDEIELVEVKTTDSDPLDYLLFNPQHRYYAVLLSKLHPNRLVTFRYVCLPTGDDEQAKTHTAWALTPKALAVAEVEMLAVADEITNNTPRARWSWRCRRCDYSRLDTARVQGVDWTGIAEEEFVRHER